jgi:hypothetical protein
MNPTYDQVLSADAETRAIIRPYVNDDASMWPWRT